MEAGGECIAEEGIKIRWPIALRASAHARHYNYLYIYLPMKKHKLCVIKLWN